MDYETLLTVQGYAKFFLILVVFIIFYSYAWSLYKRQRTGERDFEKYSNLVHDDSSVSAPLEERKKDSDIDNKEK
jgi:cytochrome c oxidase cbb3-type subunit 4